MISHGAVADFQKVLKVDPQHASAQFGLALAPCNGKGKVDEARAALGRFSTSRRPTSGPRCRTSTGTKGNMDGLKTRLTRRREGRTNDSRGLRRDYGVQHLQPRVRQRRPMSSAGACLKSLCTITAFLISL